jgi:ribonuclease HIII
MTTPQIRIIDGDTTTDRDMNAEELAILKTIQDDAEAQDAALAAKAIARQALLEKLGITEEEAQLLLGGS